MSAAAMTIRLLLALLWAAAAASQTWAQAGDPAAAPSAEVPQRRVALVIGNNAYETAPLANSVNDARDMAQALSEAGFSVTLLSDVDQRQFQLALREFGDRLRAAGSGGTGLFYYAGHGVQIKGRNFLIPVRSNVVNEDEVAYVAVDAQSVLDKMESAGNGTNIVILDACRNNPFTRSTRSAQQGLAQMDAPVGTLVAYATAPGLVAVDSRPGMRNGLYTAHLLEAVRTRGLKVEDVFKQVRNAVLRASGNKQQPWESTALVGDFYFHPPRDGSAPTVVAALPVPAAPTAPAIDPQAAIDDALWEAVRDSRASAEIFAYLNRFPAGRHAREARVRLLGLAQPGAGASGTPPPAPGVMLGAPLRTVLPGSPGGPVRISADQIASWAPAGGEPRPMLPRRNVVGFAEGDRFEYRKTDRSPGGGITEYLWQIDRIADDGTLSVNGGRQRLDAYGQRQGGTDEQTGLWTELSPPLPLQELARRGAGVTMPFSTTARVRYADLRAEEIVLSGQLRTSADTMVGLAGTSRPIPLGLHAMSSEMANTAVEGTGGPVPLGLHATSHGTADTVASPRVASGPIPCIKIEFAAEGTGRVIHWAGSRTVRLHWRHTYWMAPPLLLPVAFEITEVADDLPRQDARHEMIAIDQLSLTEAASASNVGGR